MTAKLKTISEPHIGVGDRDLKRHARLIITMSWAVLMISLVTALALWQVGAPIPVILLLAPLVLAGTVMLMATKSLRADLKHARLITQRLEAHIRSLEEACGELEFRRATEINDLEHRTLLLQASADVMSSINSTIFRPIKDLDHGLAESVDIIGKRFGFPMVNIFMIETDLVQGSETPGETKVATRLRLHAASTETGRQLIKKGYALSLDQDNSIVVTAARTRNPIFAGISHPFPPYLEDVDSPFNQSEVALPLMMGEKLLGVLYLQGSMTSPLRNEDLNVLLILANQLSITIENNILLISSQNKMQALEQAEGNLGQGAKQIQLRRQHDRGYRAGSSGEPITVSDPWHPMMLEARESGQIVFGDPVADAYTLAVPVKIRDQVAGVVRLRKPEEAGKWRPEEVALVQRLSDRLSAALESARLFEETRRTAEREHLTGEITARMRSTNDPQVVLQIAARELRKALRADKAQLLVQTAVSHLPKVDEVDADNQAGDQP